MPIYKGKCRNLGWCDAALDGADVEVQASGPADARCPQCGEPLEIVRPPATFPYPGPHPVPPPQSAWGRMAAAMAAGLLLGGAGLAYAGRWQSAGVNAAGTQAVAQPFVRDSAARVPAAVPTAVPVDSAARGVVTSAFPDAKQLGGPAVPKLPSVPSRGYPPPGAEQGAGWSDAPPPDSEPAVALPVDATITVRPESAYCASQMLRGRNLAFVLADALPLPGGGSLQPGTPVTGQVTARDVGSTPDAPDRVQVELSSIEVPGVSLGIVTSPLAVEMRRDRSAATGTVLRYGVIGAVAGASVAVLLHRNAGLGALFGLGGGAAIGGLRAAAADPCFVKKETRLPFRLVAQAAPPSP